MAKPRKYLEYSDQLLDQSYEFQSNLSLQQYKKSMGVQGYLNPRNIMP